MASDLERIEGQLEAERLSSQQKTSQLVEISYIHDEIRKRYIGWPILACYRYTSVSVHVVDRKTFGL